MCIGKHKSQGSKVKKVKCEMQRAKPMCKKVKQGAKMMMQAGGEANSKMRIFEPSLSSCFGPHFLSLTFFAMCMQCAKLVMIC